RGFVEEVWLTADQFRGDGERRFQRSPVRELHLSECRGWLPSLDVCPLLQNLLALDLSGNYLGGMRGLAVQRLAASSLLCNLESLDLSSNLIGDQSLAVLSQSP